jgi:hypothetical protein
MKFMNNENHKKKSKSICSPLYLSPNLNEKFSNNAQNGYIQVVQVQNFQYFAQ